MNNRFGIYPYMYVLMLIFSAANYIYSGGVSLGLVMGLIWSAVYALMMMFPVWLIKEIASHKGLTIVKTAILGGLIFSIANLLTGWSGLLSGMMLGDPKLAAGALSAGLVSALTGFVFGATVGTFVGTLLSIRVSSGRLKSQKP